MFKSSGSLLVITVFLSAGPVPADSGELPSGGTSAAAVAGRVPLEPGPPAGLDDTLRPIAESAGAPPSGAERGEVGDPPAPERQDVSAYLAGLPRDRWTQATLSVDLTAGAPPSSLARASGASALWRGGRFEDALDELRALEHQGLVDGAGIGWRTPVPAAPWKAGGTDVRIGTRTAADEMALDYDMPTGNLFALVDWGDGVGWALNLSTDGGATWSETYFWCCNVGTADFSVVDGFAYVGYTVTTSPSEARLRRHFAASGAVDAAYSFQTVLDATPATVVEIALASNAENFDNRIYYAMLLSDGSVRFFFDDSADGTTFGDFSPGASNASRGLDVAWNTDFPIYFMFLSYVGTDSSIYVHRADGEFWDGGTAVALGQTAADKTSISAFGDTALVSYEYNAANGQGAEYRITYDGGANWNVGSFEPDAGAGAFFDPQVTARSGIGTAMIYQQETGALDTLFFQDRAGYAPGAWNPAEPLNDHDFFTGAGDRFAFDWLGFGYGVAYADNGGAVYFDVASLIFADGFESGDLSAWTSSVGGPSCVLGTDSDGDRLDNCWETDTGVFVSATDTGTDPNNDDTDGDSLLDGDEVLGTLGGLDLPGMGTNPLRQNILLEYDWFDDSLDCAAHSHRPTAAQIALVTAAFAGSPEVNPDGSTGITTIHDYGQGGLFTGGNLIPDADGVLAEGVNGAEFQAHKAANFAANRHGYFHYTLLPHRYNTTSGSSGQAELPGDDLIVSLQCFLSTTNVGNTIMHELGHNLNLRHGGFENCNYKPNYNSVMSYRYQFPGVDNDCTPPGDGVLDYSVGDRIILDENDLNENLGICGAPPWDWDGDTIIEPSVTVDINSDDAFQIANCGGTLTVLQDFDDWANLDLTGLLDADRRLSFQEIIDCDNRPPEAGK